MERSKLADLSEILSSIAIVITLVYLTIEIRQNTNALAGQTRQAVLASAQAELTQLLENPDLVVTMASTGPLESPQQHVRMDAWLSQTMRGREFAWLQYQAGTIDQAQWDTETAVLLSIFDSPLNRVWWERMGRHAVGPDFGAFVDNAFEQNPATGEMLSAVLTWSLPQ